MAIAFWQDQYCTGDHQTDREHQDLFALVNTLHDALTQAEHPATLRGILEELASHTLDHFRTEEVLMQNHNYPDYGRHKQSHDRLEAKVRALLQRIEADESALTADIPAFLADWLVHHIKGEDQKMISFLKTQVRDLVSC
ncbi:MAG: bacteriohemerythrin [Thermosynechococcaceae cyanobacterium MS004]|nr:bacteriohemerythrin [Thermosynechococcaceae cyanobacterium MS004]